MKREMKTGVFIHRLEMEMNYEVIDNIFQISMMGLSFLAAVFLAIRYKDRRFVTLAFSYACFGMGTLYYLLYLLILNDIPHVSYVAEFSWMAAYLFLWGLQLLRMESVPIRFCWKDALYPCVVVWDVCRWHILGPSLLSTLAFSVVLGVVAYLSFFHLHQETGVLLLDVCILLCTFLQIALYISSSFMTDFNHFNLYFAFDFLLTGFWALLLPLTVWEVKSE